MSTTAAIRGTEESDCRMKGKSAKGGCLSCCSVWRRRTKCGRCRRLCECLKQGAGDNGPSPAKRRTRNNSQSTERNSQSKRLEKRHFSSVTLIVIVHLSSLDRVQAWHENSAAQRPKTQTCTGWNPPAVHPPPPSLARLPHPAIPTLPSSVTSYLISSIALLPIASRLGEVLCLPS